MKLLINNLSESELENTITGFGIPKYRASQIRHWILSSRVTKFTAMSNLPSELREKLDNIFYVSSIYASTFQKFADGTIKFLFSLVNGTRIESVLIPDENRMTLCVSSQVGCPLGCVFCATGKLKFTRNLDAAEIVDQVLEAEKIAGMKISNLVFMGMGEPLLNYENVIKGIGILSGSGFNIVSRKRITVSTVGIVPQIKQLADEKKPVKLAVSLHATTDDARCKIIPVASKWNISSLRQAIEYYYHKTKIPVTYEYIVFDEFNNSPDDVKRLARFVRGIPSKVNLIPYHDIKFTNPAGIAKDLIPASNEKIHEFASRLRECGVNVFIRASSGSDIDAACGQLAFSEVNRRIPDADQQQPNGF